MAVNRKARRNYEVKDTLEAGIVLTGAEVKSVKENRVVLSDAFVKEMGGQLWLINADIARYKYMGDADYDPTRSRKLLVKKREKEMLVSKTKQGGLTIIPLKMYVTRGLVKVEIGIGKGRKVHEKRAVEKERDLERDLHREKRRHMIQ